MLIDSAYLISSGVLLFASIHIFVIAFSQERRMLFLTFSVLSLFAFIYQFACYWYFNSTDLAHSVIAIKVQLYALSLFYVSFYLFTSIYTNTYHRYLFIFICCYAGLLVIINTIAPYSIRFDAPAELREFQFLDQTLYAISAQQSVYGKVLHSFGIVFLIWALFALYKLAKKKIDLFTIGFALFILLFVVTGSIGAKIDLAEIDAVYIPGFIFTAFIIFISFLLQKDIRQQNQLLKKYHSSIEVIAKGVAYRSGHIFYDQLANNLGQIFNAKYCFIGLLEPQSMTITTKAVSVYGKTVENFSYDLEHTPCEKVMEREVCHYADNIQALFPKDALLQEMNIRSYIGAPIVNEEGNPVGLFVVLDTKPKAFSHRMNHILDIFSARASAELQRDDAESRMRVMAYEDYLTRLPNRAQAYEFLQQKVGTHSHVCLYLLDLDHFKNINDALGHDVGDELLRNVGHRVNALMEDILFKSRIGGDEFLIVTAAYSDTLMEQLSQLFNEPIVIGDHVIDLNSSIGIAEIDTRSTSVLEMMRFVELALYKAKSQGRNCSIIYEPALQSLAIEKLKIQSALKSALQSDNALSLHYQPQLRSNGSVYGAEALLRWYDPEMGHVSPMTFIQLAEETGLIHPIGEWVLSESLNMLASIQNHPNFSNSHLSINISAWQFALPNFVEHVIDKVEQADVPPAMVMLELTETAVLHDIEDAKRKLTQLRAYGIKIALDDFGTGYSSLAYLRQLPIDVLKIDKAFIDEIQENTDSPLTDSIVSIGRSIRVDVIAEGVEQAIQANHLEKLGCTIYQGYYFSKPLPEEVFLEWLSNSEIHALDSNNEFFTKSV